MYDASPPCANCPPEVGEKGPLPAMADGAPDAIDWDVLTFVIARPLGTLRWPDDDLRFLLGPESRPVGDAGRDRLRGVVVPDVI